MLRTKKRAMMGFEFNIFLIVTDLNTALPLNPSFVQNIAAHEEENITRKGTMKNM